MKSYEEQYIENLRNILENGIREYNARTGKETLRLPSTSIIVDLEKEFPILQSKTVNWKICADEIFWIMQKNSNNVHELNSHIWDKWADEDGSIGKTYGYQVGKSVRADLDYKNQVDYVLTKLQNDPSNRQCVIDMWDPEEICEMNLPPCVYSSIWNIIDGKLNCMVVQRSSDYPVGVPFDTTGYAILTHLFARHLNVKPGLLTHVMADSHIYVDQIDGVKTQLERYDVMVKDPEYLNKKLPQLILNTTASSFWDMSPENMEIINNDPRGVIKFEVAK